MNYFIIHKCINVCFENINKPKKQGTKKKDQNKPRNKYIETKQDQGQKIIKHKTEKITKGGEPVGPVVWRLLCTFLPTTGPPGFPPFVITFPAELPE